MCEQLQLALMQQEMDLKPCLRRLHLVKPINKYNFQCVILRLQVVTAIREFIQAVETYKKSSHLSIEDKELVTQLQSRIKNHNKRCRILNGNECYS
jgi:timeless